MAAAEKPLFVTSDLYMRRPGILDPADQEVLRHVSRCISLTELLAMQEEEEAEGNGEDAHAAEDNEPLVPGAKLTPADIIALGRQAGGTLAVFTTEVQGFLTRDKALEVKALRVGHYSWRAIASECYRRWGGQWEPASNQIAGIALCECSARLLGEDPYALPWNDER